MALSHGAPLGLEGTSRGDAGLSTSQVVGGGGATEQAKRASHSALEPSTEPHTSLSVLNVTHVFYVDPKSHLL